MDKGSRARKPITGLIRPGTDDVAFSNLRAGQVQIQIIDLGGQMIYEQQIQSQGGHPEEIEIIPLNGPRCVYCIS